MNMAILTPSPVCLASRSYHVDRKSAGQVSLDLIQLGRRLISVLARIACALLLIAAFLRSNAAAKRNRASRDQRRHRSRLPRRRQFARQSHCRNVVNSLTVSQCHRIGCHCPDHSRCGPRDFEGVTTELTDASPSLHSPAQVFADAEARGFSLQYFEHHDPFATAIAVGPGLDTEHLVFRLQPDASIEARSPTTTTSPSRTQWCASSSRVPRRSAKTFP